MGNIATITAASHRLAAVLFLLAAIAGALLPAVTVYAESNPISIESRDVPRLDTQTDNIYTDNVYTDEVVPFRQPIEEEPSEALTGNEMSYQMQLLQQEVQTLRGIVETLSYELSRLQSTQDDRYLELDQRFQNLTATGGMTQPSASGISAPTVTDSPLTGSKPSQVTNSLQNGGDINPASSRRDDKALYDTALELIRGRQYDLAITQLEALISQHPDSKLAPNAYYWLGEVFTAKPEPNYEEARKALAQVITYFPEHRKVPDAAFKLGKVYNLMGNCKRATELLEQVIEREQGKSVAKVAQTYLRDKVGNCP